MDVDGIKDQTIDDQSMEDDDQSDSSSDENEEVSDNEDVVKNDKDDQSDEKPTAFVPGQSELQDGEELVMDEQAYIIYHQASLGPPCLSFDVIPDDLGKDLTKKNSKMCSEQEQSFSERRSIEQKEVAVLHKHCNLHDVEYWKVIAS